MYFAVLSVVSISCFCHDALRYYISGVFFAVCALVRFFMLLLLSYLSTYRMAVYSAYNAGLFYLRSDSGNERSMIIGDNNVFEVRSSVKARSIGDNNLIQMKGE